VRLAVKVYDPQVSSGKPDVVLIHGTGADGNLWQPQIELLLKQGYRCIVPELRGHGGTDEPGEHTDIQTHIDDLLETLEQCQVKYPAIFIGHSLGAIISMNLAESRPELFEQVLAVSMPGRVLKFVSRAFKIIVSYPFEPLRGTFLHRSLSKRHQILFATHRHSLQQIVNNFAKLNFIEQGMKVTCPVHFCVGRLDFVAPYFYVRRMHQTMTNSSLHIFEWAGHCCMDDQPEQFNQWLLDKLSNGCPASSLSTI